ncbi:hypothetical protein [Actinacidiphila yeochonensis]|uniref:hypothetical protein n=1 Tax=Actinacidiphila yeochonensis TaxID=89050 RepID=UPI00055E131F|nr:hypothetical protein [Actinacidiphila yeochonensis]
MAERQFLGRGVTTSWEGLWYVLGCIGFGAAYFAKVPVKKALSEYGLVEMTGAEKFWYVLQCVGFGAGYFHKTIIKKALSEVREGGPAALAATGYAVPPQTGQPAV